MLVLPLFVMGIDGLSTLISGLSAPRGCSHVLCPKLPEHDATRPYRETILGHPYKTRDFLGEINPCEVRFWSTGLTICGRAFDVTAVEMGRGCVIPEPDGYLAQSHDGRYVRTDFEGRRTDPLSVFERVGQRSAERPIAATTLLLVWLGAAWFIARPRTRTGWWVLYLLYAWSVCWTVFAFTSGM